MNMYWIVISGIVIISVLWIIGYRARRKHPEASLPVNTEDNHETTAFVIASCCAVIEKALESLSGNDVVSACRNHRTGLTGLKILEQRTALISDDRQQCSIRTYRSYMIEACGKIAEICRLIVSAPDSRMTSSDISEIGTLRNGMVRLMEIAGGQSAPVSAMEDIARQMETDSVVIEHFISVRNKGMSLDDFDDSSYKHLFLRLLYYLRFFLNLSRRLIKVAGKEYGNAYGKV